MRYAGNSTLFDSFSVGESGYGKPYVTLMAGITRSTGDKRKPHNRLLCLAEPGKWRSHGHMLLALRN